MNEFTVGNFTVTVSGPYPVHVRIAFEGREIGSVPHYMLADLAYAIERAQRDARVLLKERAGEV